MGARNEEDAAWVTEVEVLDYTPGVWVARVA